MVAEVKEKQLRNVEEECGNLGAPMLDVENHGQTGHQGHTCLDTEPVYPWPWNLIVYKFNRDTLGSFFCQFAGNFLVDCRDDFKVADFFGWMKAFQFKWYPEDIP